MRASLLASAIRSIGCLRHGVLLVFGAPCQLRLLAGQEHGRTIPLADFDGVPGVNIRSHELKARLVRMLAQHSANYP